MRARRLAALAIGAAVTLVLAGCSSSSAPSLFPAVLDSPAPRDDAPLSPDQVKQATDNLIAERNRLCAEATANGNAAAATNCGPDNTASAGPAQTAGGAAKP
jgi:hypothetical protein